MALFGTAWAITEVIEDLVVEVVQGLESIRTSAMLGVGAFGTDAGLYLDFDYGRLCFRTSV